MKHFEGEDIGFITTADLYTKLFLRLLLKFMFFQYFHFNLTYFTQISLCFHLIFEHFEVIFCDSFRSVKHTRFINLMHKYSVSEIPYIVLIIILREELNTLRKEIETKDKDIDEKGKTINQVRSPRYSRTSDFQQLKEFLFFVRADFHNLFTYADRTLV